MSEMNGSDQKLHNQAAELLLRPKRLLATILITNNFVNVGIVIFSTYLVSRFVPAEQLNYMLAGLIPVGRVIEVVGITLILLLFGEIMPKIYANEAPVTLSAIMAFPLLYLSKMFSFLSVPLIKMTSVIDRRAAAMNNQLSVDELGHALELTHTENARDKEDRKILEGIVRFGNTDVKQIMKPRTDIEAIEIGTLYGEMLEAVIESGFSRIPVYEESLDRIHGILHMKDLLPHMGEADNFAWQELLREPFFVPESKMIDDLLEEFRDRKMHLAIVVDEYGGCEGLVTLEDIMEEIVGDISDEFDDDELIYSRLDDRSFVFEGKTNLKQFYRVLKIEGTDFEDQKGESDTLAGFILELVGKIPGKNQRVNFGNYEFTVESVDKRRIKRLKVSLTEEEETEPEENQEQRDDHGGTNTTVVLLLLALGSLIGCRPDPTPKPRGYMHIDLPPKAYHSIDTDCPFAFETADYSSFLPDVGQQTQPCWFDIEYPQFRAKWHFSYKTVDGNLPDLFEDSRTLTNKHISQASAIQEDLIIKPADRVFGTVYRVAGNRVASPLQIYLTDSTDHFLRGALYFNTTPNNDSLAPVIEFLEQDMMHVIETFRWKDS